jgi:FKBP-type peptidyl-prolyl cis-trans isomerase FklB
MKRTLMAVALLASLSAPALAADKKMPAPTMANEDSKAAYSIGYLSGRSNAQHIEKLDLDAFVAGFRDAYAKATPKFSEEEMKSALEAFRNRLQLEATEKANRAAAENKIKSAAYLAENRKKSGVTTTTSGLQYEVLTEGTGAVPKPSDMVKVHYHGTLIDGSVFDSSVQRGEPAVFQLDQVIPGWTEGLQLMKTGAKYRLTLPPELAYGEQGVGPIAANAVLVFEVELLGIEKPTSDAVAAQPDAKPKATAKSGKKK